MSITPDPIPALDLVWITMLHLQSEVVRLGAECFVATAELVPYLDGYELMLHTFGPWVLFL